MTAEQKPYSITLLFEGLMVFHKLNDGSETYEVGILRNPPDHIFTVFRNDEMGPAYSADLNEAWRVEVVSDLGSASGIGVTLNESKPGVREHRDRCENEPGNPNLQDFSWIIDFEGPEFHDCELELNPNILSPIIHLTTGTLFTDCKIPRLDYKQGVVTSNQDQDFVPLGFVAERIGLKIELAAGEKVRVTMGQRFADFSPDETHTISFFHMPVLHTLLHMQMREEHSHGMNTTGGIAAVSPEIQEFLDETYVPSDIQHYYNMLIPIDESLRFEVKFSTPAVHSSNECTVERLDILCRPYKCTALLLGRRRKPLSEV